MRTRLAALGLALVVAALVATGCAPEPAPVATPPVFATEEEAFAAAEATYRAYVDALNQVDLSDPETFEAVYAWTTGDANAGARKSFTQMHADGWVVTGPSTFDGFRPSEIEVEVPDAIAVSETCLDVSEVEVLNADGVSVVPDTRQDRQPARVTFVIGPTSTGLQISESIAIESDVCD